jgi:hypothetical protein
VCGERPRIFEVILALLFIISCEICSVVCTECVVVVIFINLIRFNECMFGMIGKRVVLYEASEYYTFQLVICHNDIYVYIYIYIAFLNM